MSAQSGLIRAVQHTREVSRILALPRRVWTDDSAATVAAELTAVLRRPHGRMALRPIQGQALLEAGIHGGGFYPIRVGGGKTLLSGLAPYVLDSLRPLILLPAKLVEKTKKEFRVLMAHWPIPNFIRFCSYELLGRVQAQTLLDQFQPDLIVADEAHKLKNRKAACTKRVDRYMRTHPTTRFIAMSGTITKRSLKDFAHIAAWCLGPNQLPLPLSWTELEDWADALDERTTEGKRIGIGAIRLFMNDEEKASEDQLTAARKAQGRRLIETPAVVASRDKGPNCSLSIEAMWGDREILMGPAIEAAFEKLRKEWRTPDDWPLADPMSVWRVARELSLGFYYVWDPRPPDVWANARKVWAAWCREILTTNRRNLDSELQVTNAVADGLYPEAKPALDEWRKVKNSFEPNSVPVWLDDSVIKAATLWAHSSPGIVWTEHTAFAKRLAKHAKLVYYGKQGRAQTGPPRLVDTHPADESLIASIDSCGEGFNLQKWHRNLITSCPNSCGGKKGWEQVVGRTHRDDQEADEVIVDLVVTSVAHLYAFEQAIKDALRIEASIPGQPQKLLYADRLVPDPTEVAHRPGYRWIK